MRECHRCKFNGKGSNECLQCAIGENDEVYAYPYNKYILDTYDPPAQDTSTSEKATDLDEEQEDKFKKFLYDLFDLSNNELLMLKYIMNGGSLTEFAREMEKQAESNKSFTRFRAFQTRKILLRKLGEQFKGALLTARQKKPLKG